MIKMFYPLITLLVTLLIYGSPVYAKDIDDLVNEQQLSVKLSVLNKEQISAKQQVTLAIEIATDRWFAKGTQITPFEVEQSVVLPLTELAINGTERINGKTWVTQIREVSFYPLKEGIYTIPAISISVSINTEHHGIVSGTIYTEPLEIDVSKPSELAGIEDYIVTSSFSVDIENNLEKDNIYKIGEAITQTITFKAHQVPSMMLPVLKPPTISGLSIYLKPAQLSDTSNRGVLQGVRTETFSFIFEQPGNYQVSGQEFYWWNSHSNTLESVKIPELSWTVSGEVAQLNSVEKFQLTNFNSNNIFYGLLALLSLYLINKIRLNIRFITRYWRKITKKQIRALSKQYLQYVENQQFRQASFALFKLSQLVNRNSALTEDVDHVVSLRKYYLNSPEQARLLENLLNAGYSKEKSIFTLADARNLINAPKKALKFGNHSINENRIKLNIPE
jgi:hypothetical protein